jgi:hypothetical protein
MKKLLILLIFASCEQIIAPIEPVKEHSILGTWSRSYDVYSERYRFADVEGSYLWQCDTMPSIRKHYGFDWHLSNDTIYLYDGYDFYDTLLIQFIDSSLIINGNTFQ